ncbi:hypothetical protein QBC47DRAFT_394651 [Echria macrotheca]|uniref:Uncharacterized protein n=1 Tax=Echria macrotheca TaxID=438768 RepID=A0AAJ0B1U1_9PEZI|nr:hypothetical protein QBC47DRAFT_394651 [Echria macrotheca]
MIKFTAIATRTARLAHRQTIPRISSNKRLASTMGSTYNTAAPNIPGAPIPIFVVGQREEIAQFVIEAVKPEYEVVQMILGKAAKEELPIYLRGEIPATKSSQLGSNNWAVPPRAILIGGAFNDAEVAELRQTVVDAGATRKIPWLHVDHNKPRPVIVGNEAQYGDSIAQRFKDALNRLRDEGRLDADGDDSDVLV